MRGNYRSPGSPDALGDRSPVLGGPYTDARQSVGVASGRSRPTRSLSAQVGVVEQKKVELASVFPISGRQDVIYLGNPTIMKILEKSNRSSAPIQPPVNFRQLAESSIQNPRCLKSCPAPVFFMILCQYKHIPIEKKIFQI